MLRALEPADWAQPTDCPGWDVRAVAGLVLGMAEMVASPRGLLAQSAAAARVGGSVHALTAHQVRTRAPGRRRARRAVRGRGAAGRARRRRLARILGRLPLPEQQVVGDQRGRWLFSFLCDIVLTRDTWMHRADITRALGRRPVLTLEHDGRLVADVVAEWAQRHGQSYRLHLTGSAGGTWSVGAEGPPLELDAVEFCRVLSGRGTAAGLLRRQVAF